MKLKELFESPPYHKKWSGVDLPMNQWGDVTFEDMGLKWLDELPKKIFTGFSCRQNQLSSLLGGPEWVGSFYDCSDNKLTSLEGIAGHIGGSLLCQGNKLKSLKGIHKQINLIETRANFTNNPIKSHVLGLLKIDSLQFVGLDNDAVGAIINKHLKGDRDIFACQEELIEAGFPEFAQL